MDILLNRTMLSDKIVLLTGGGGGIGFETAKAFAEMGAKILIAEVNQEKIEKVATYFNQFYPNTVEFFHVDLSKETEIIQFYENILDRYNCPDIIFNNAALVITGKIGEVKIEDWNLSYSVNLKAPILITTLFLEKMKQRDSGCIVFVSSSGAAPYLSAYEIYKTAQVEFSNALSLELEGTHVYTYTIAPGLVRTETAEKSITTIATSMGISTNEFYNQNNNLILDVRSAGIGFAVSTLKPKEYNGQEISSIQSLNDFGAKFSVYNENQNDMFSPNIEILRKVVTTFLQQYSGWQERNIFERQWVLRDFKKYVGISAETCKKELEEILEKTASEKKLNSKSIIIFQKLLCYWEHQLKLLQGFEKNQRTLAEHSKTISEWISDIKFLLTVE